MKRTLQRLVLDPLVLKVLQGEYKEGDTVDGDALAFRTGKQEPIGVAS